MTEATNWERHVTLARGMSAASFMKQDSVERKVRSSSNVLSRSFLFLKPGASPGAAHHPTEQHARLIGAECATHSYDFAGVIYRVDPVAGIVYGQKGKPIVCLLNGYVSIRRTPGRPNRRALHRFAHRAVWESVYGPMPAGMQINHINGIKTDNRIANLELVTPKQNAQHAVRTGLKKPVCGASNGQTKLTVEIAREIRASKDTYAALAARYGVAEGTIHAVREYKTWRDA